MRTLWTLTGWLSFGLGFVGAFVPLLPTVPFMLLAAYCFARGSERFHEWLITHPRFGPPILDWQERGMISRKAKLMAGIAIAVTFGISVLLGLQPMILAIQVVVLTAVLVFIFTRPSSPKRRKRHD